MSPEEELSPRNGTVGIQLLLFAHMDPSRYNSISLDVVQSKRDWPGVSQ